MIYEETDKVGYCLLNCLGANLPPRGIPHIRCHFLSVEQCLHIPQRKGFSQKKLAERCKAAHSYIRQIESGKGHPSFVFIGKLAKALDIEPYQLFYDETAANSEKPAQPDYIESIKTDFISTISNEFDVALKKLKV